MNSLKQTSRQSAMSLRPGYAETGSQDTLISKEKNKRNKSAAKKSTPATHISAPLTTAQMRANRTGAQDKPHTIYNCFTLHRPSLQMHLFVSPGYLKHISKLSRSPSWSL
ncbi:hypothetical protein Dimus_021079 [Dionaea muscipula]